MAADGAMTQPFDTWVDEAQGTVSREVFVSDIVHQYEIERIFNRVWLYLGHESEIPNAGDLVTRTLAKDPVILVRRTDGSIGGFLNSCRHRGTRLCRIEFGNTKGFVCPYHGWSYDLNGKLLSTSLDSLYPEDMDFSEWGLIEIPRMSSYKGLIFGSWNESAEPLEEYLGDVRWYLDLFFARTPRGMEVLGPPQRSIVAVNWKIPAINFGTDNAHVNTTHIGPFTLATSVIPISEMRQALRDAVQVSTSNGHSCSLISFPGEPYRYYPADLRPHYEQTLAESQRLVLRNLGLSIGTIFPNLSFIENSPKEIAPGVYTRPVVLRLWQPLGSEKIEIVSWCLAEAEAKPEEKRSILAQGISNFGIAGLFEQDDVELWSSINSSSGGPTARRYPMCFKTALPYMSKPIQGFAGPGNAYRPFASEVTQFKFFQNWNRLMREDVR